MEYNQTLQSSDFFFYGYIVLILVLMEYNQTPSGWLCLLAGHSVLILVLMEYNQTDSKNYAKPKDNCLNPCSNGIQSNNL